MKRIIWIWLLCVLITGCATVSPPSTKPLQLSWKERQVSLNRLERWQLTGKIAVITAEQAGSATVNWTEQPHLYTISLLGPLGSNGLKLTGQAGLVTLETSDGKHASAKTAEQLLAQQWGWHLPVSNLTYWVRGLPVPGLQFNGQFDAYNRLSSMVQAGWDIRYLSYSTVGSFELPSRISITSPRLKTKLVIYEWKIG